MLLALLLLACRAADPGDQDGDGDRPPYDCDDADPGVHVDAAEWCDGLDDDCDGVIDEDAEDAVTLYDDRDGDGFGDDSTAVVLCQGLDGRVTEGGDCDDDDPNSYPGATDTCGDGLDQDCDGSDATCP